MMHHSGVYLTVKWNQTRYFGLALSGWTILVQSTECFLPVDGAGMGEVLAADK